MKVIDLLNKIANGEAPQNIKYRENEYYLFDSKSYLTTDKSRFFDTIHFKELDEEVEIIEEDKKIERLPYYDYGKIMASNNKLKTMELMLEKHEKRLNDNWDKINELIDEVNKLKEKE